MYAYTRRELSIPIADIFFDAGVEPSGDWALVHCLSEEHKINRC